MAASTETTRNGDETAKKRVISNDLEIAKKQENYENRLRNGEPANVRRLFGLRKANEHASQRYGMTQLIHIGH